MQVAYWLDHQNKIVKVSELWDTFACQNGGNTILSKFIIGTALLTHVADDTTRMWTDAVLQYARLSNQPLERLYRCDSYDQKRYMKMIVTPENDSGLLKLEHFTLKVEQMDKPFCFSHDETNMSTILRCSLCNKIKIEELWDEPDLYQFDETGSQRIIVIHTVCPQCSKLSKH